MGARARKIFLAAAAACTVAVTVAASFAEAGHIRRSDCFNTYSAAGRGRQMGVRNGLRLFNQIWNRLDRNCAQLDRLTQIISETPLAAPRSAMGACFAQGYTETLFQMLDDAYIRCGDRCYMAGAEIGQISAMGYCAASMAVDGLDDPGFIAQPALPFCGTNLVFGCKTEYVQAATVEIAGCRAYTEGSFEQIFDNTVRQDCYVPSDVPIRDRFAFGYFDSGSAALF